MTDTLLQEISGPIDERQFLAALMPRLPRMAAVSAVAMVLCFAAIQFMPQTFEARLALDLPAGNSAPAEAEKLLDQQHLAEVVSQLPPQVIAELRGNGGGMLDTTALLRQRLVLTPTEDGENLDLAATAGTPARARAIVDAMAEGYATLAELPPALAPAKPEEAVASAEVMPVAPNRDNDTVAQLQERLSLAWEERIKLESRAQRIQSLIADGNYAMLALDAENLPGLGRKLDNLATLEAERTRLAVDFLPNHPRMRTINEEIDQLSSDLSEGMQQLASLVTADRDAAQRREDSLRKELAAATMPVAADTTVVTGAIAGPVEPRITALPRPVRTDLALALSGGLTFFGQIGLFALLRPRVEDVAEASGPLGEPEQADSFASTSQPATYSAMDHNWLDLAALPDTDVDAGWAAEPCAPAAPAAPAASAAPQPHSLGEEARAALDTARIVTIRCRGETGGAARRLLASYQGQNKRVVLVDAASRRRGRAPGISDLSQNLASFADIIHGSGSHEAALIPWGRQAQFDPGAKSVRILIQALAELYDVVILTLDGDNLAAAAPLAALADLTLEADAVPALAKAAA